MIIYLFFVIAVSISLFVFYIKSKSRTKEKDVLKIIDYGISVAEQEEFISAAFRSKKINSPVSEECFQDLSISGTAIVNEELFLVNDVVVGGSGYRVL